MIDNIKPKDVVFVEPSTTTKTDTIAKETPDFYKGKSFRWAGEWAANKLYANDEYHVDYVRHDGKMWVCTKSHYSTTPPGSDTSPWQLALDFRTTAIHIGTDEPTQHQYGDHWQDLIWLDTGDESNYFEVYSKSQTEERLSAALENSKTYTDAGIKDLETKTVSLDTQNLTKAKEYTDVEISKAKTYSNEKASEAKDAALSSAKAYSEGLAKNYDKSGAAAQALIDSKLYTNEKVEKGINKLAAKPSTVLTTYSELKKLQGSGTLSPGAFYRITDYECSTTQANTRCANHPFDIIVQALDNHALSELAHAIAREDDTYFALANLNAWRLKYTLENDTTKHSWAKVEVLEKPALWSSDWGVLEERYDNGDSSNYEIATVDGKRIFLYRPTNPTSFLDGLSFVRKVTSGAVTTPNGFIYEADSAPYEEGSEEYGYYWEWSDVYEIRVKTASGKYVATLYHDANGTYYDSNDSDYMWPITFDPNAKWSDNEVYLFTPDSGVEDWWQEIMGGVFVEASYEPYTGPINSLYYAFDNPLYKGTPRSVKMLSDKQHVYFINEDEDDFDTVAYSAYVAHEEGGKGVIYEMIDEHGNHCPFDFKNMQFLHEEEWYYTFSFKGNDLSLTDYCVDNYIYANRTAKFDDTTTAVPSSIPMVILDAKPNASGKTIGFAHNSFECSIAKGYISATRIENFIWKPKLGGSIAAVDTLYINTTDVCYGNTISGSASTFTVGSSNTPATAFYDNEIHLATYQKNAFKCNAATFVNNKLDLAESSAGFAITVGSMTSCHITNTYYERNQSSDKIEFGANVILRDCAIKMYQALTINYANTTSTTTPLRFLNIDARGWNASTITVPTTFPTNANYELKVAKNSNGVIKMWCDADLAN